MKNTIRVQRAIHELTQQQLADRIGVGVQTINHIENNKAITNIRVAVLLAEYFKVPVEQLFRIEAGDRFIKGDG